MYGVTILCVCACGCAGVRGAGVRVSVCVVLVQASSSLTLVHLGHGKASEESVVLLNNVRVTGIRKCSEWGVRVCEVCCMYVYVCMCNACVGVFCVSVCARCATISYSSGSVEPHVRASGVQRKSAI